MCDSMSIILIHFNNNVLCFIFYFIILKRITLTYLFIYLFLIFSFIFNIFVNLTFIIIDLILFNKFRLQ